MGERKVQAKYYPPDFDPSKLPRIKKKRANDDAVRFMLPMSVRCESCGEFMGAGLKFNARKSNTGDDYLGLRIFRFTMRCKGCPASFAIRTDPKNSDYSCESGVRRNFEPWREAKKEEQDADDERNRQDQDAMQALENKTLDAKQQMEELDALDHIKTVNAKRARVSVDEILTKRRQQNEFLTEADERQIAEEAKLVMMERKRRNEQSATMENLFTAKSQDAKVETLVNTPSVLPRLARLKAVKKIKKPIEKTPAKAQPVQSSAAKALVAYDDTSSDSDGEDQ